MLIGIEYKDMMKNNQNFNVTLYNELVKSG